MHNDDLDWTPAPVYNPMQIIVSIFFPGLPITRRFKWLQQFRISAIQRKSKRYMIIVFRNRSGESFHPSNSVVSAESSVAIRSA